MPGDASTSVIDPDRRDRAKQSVKTQDALSKRILAAAVDLAREVGLAAVRTKRVAELAECAEGSIFNHFGDKGGLLAAVLTYGLPEARAYIAALDAARNSADGRESLIAILRTLYAYYQVGLPLAGAAFADQALFSRYAEAHRQAGTGPQMVWQLLAAHLRDRQQRGSIDTKVDVEIEAIALAGACQNAAWVFLISGPSALPSRCDGADFVSRLVDQRWSVLAPDTTRSV